MDNFVKSVSSILYAIGMILMYIGMLIVSIVIVAIIVVLSPVIFIVICVDKSIQLIKEKKKKTVRYNTVETNTSIGENVDENQENNN